MRVSLVAAALALVAAGDAAAEPRWSKERAQAWQADGPSWRVGANYIPSTAINPIEMWDPETFDPATIDRELAAAEKLGFNTMRVYLHDIPWRQDPEGFYRRVDQYLAIANRHGIRTMLVLFDSCWDPNPHPGKQRAPIPDLHNSGWSQSPGAEYLRDPARFDTLKPYVQGVMRRFARDPRIDAWDVWNEPDNRNLTSYGKLEPKNKGDLITPLLEKTFAWAKEIDTVQPITSPLWDQGDGASWAEASLKPFQRVQLDNSDVVSFHSYDPPRELKRRIAWLERLGRPLYVSEYMARPRGSTFQAIMPLLKRRKIGALSWGFVDGKSNTKQSWSSWDQAPEDRGEPTVWFHDILKASLEPYDAEEVAFIRRVTPRAPAAQAAKVSPRAAVKRPSPRNSAAAKVKRAVRGRPR